jgi:hypothetical protein
MSSCRMMHRSLYGQDSRCHLTKMFQESKPGYWMREGVSWLYCFFLLLRTIDDSARYFSTLKHKHSLDPCASRSYPSHSTIMKAIYVYCKIIWLSRKTRYHQRTAAPPQAPRTPYSAAREDTRPAIETPTLLSYPIRIGTSVLQSRHHTLKASKDARRNAFTALWKAHNEPIAWAPSE